MMARRVMAGRNSFSPLALFANNEQGAWYDPSDLSTLFQDSAGTTPVTAVEQPVGKLLDKSGRGNHAYQSTDANRPVVSARYNLLTKTEQFSDVAWTKEGLLGFGSGSVANTTATTDPLGGNTADLVTQSTSNSTHRLLSQAYTFQSNASYVASVYVKSAGHRYIQLTIGAVINDPDLTERRINIDLQSNQVVTNVSNGSGQCVDVGNGWARISFTMIPPSTATANKFAVALTDASYTSTFTGDGTSGIYVWGADLRVANDGTNAPEYQYVNTDTDYVKNCFPLYLKFDGSDDFLKTNAIDFTATDKMTVFAGVRKIRDTVQSVVSELSATIASNNGAFLLSAPHSAAANYNWSSKGTALSDNTVISYAAQITNVLTASGDISGDGNILRVNGTQAGTSASDQGTGNYGNHALYLGARAGTSLFFNGRLYSLIVRGAETSANLITAVERYVAKKTGVPY